MKLECYLRTVSLSDCGLYRYALTHYWGEEPDNQKESDFCAFIGLNPSTADAFADDPTIRRCVGFAKRLNFKGLGMLNAFAFRATDPRKMLKVTDPIGPENDEMLRNALRVSRIIAAWGTHCTLARERRLQEIFKDAQIMCLGTNNDGSPKHPLYISADQELVPYKWRSEPSLFSEASE